MKTALDPRHLYREKLIKKLFSLSFLASGKNIRSVKEIRPIMLSLEKIDPLIAQCAPEWPIEKLNKIDLAILRLAVYELLKKVTPPKVVIDEAIELAKKYGATNSAKFINGVLGATLTKLPKQDV